MYQKLTFFIIVIAFVLNRIDAQKLKTRKYINVNEMIFLSDRFAIVNSTIRIPQLNCVNRTKHELCIQKYLLRSVTCKNDNYDSSEEPDWICKGENFYDEQTFETELLKCENFENSNDTFIDGSCYFNYTLKWIIQDNSRETYWAESIAISLFVILVLIVIIGACWNFFFIEDDVNQESKPLNLTNSIIGSSILTVDSKEKSDTLSVIYSE